MIAAVGFFSPYNDDFDKREDTLEVLNSTSANERSLLDDTFYEDSFIHETLNPVIESDSEELIEELSKAMGASPLEWAAFNRHLSTLVLDALAEENISVSELADFINVPAEVLADYLDPATDSVIGAFFLDIMEVVEIADYKLFPNFNIHDDDILDLDLDNEDETISHYKMEMEELKNIKAGLSLILSELDPYTLVKYLEYQPGDQFEAYLLNVLDTEIEKIRVIEQFKNDDEEFLYYDESLEDYDEYVEIHIADIKEAIQNKSLHQLFDDCFEPDESMLNFLVYGININPLDVIELKPIPNAELLELQRRLEKESEIQMSIQEGRFEKESSEFEAPKEWSPEDVDYQSQDNIGGFQESENYENEEFDEADFEAEPEASTEMKVKEVLSSTLSQLISGKVSWS